MYGRPADILPFINALKPGLLTALILGYMWFHSDQRKQDLKEKEISSSLIMLLCTIVSVIFAANVSASLFIFQNQVMYLLGFMLAALIALKNEKEFKSFFVVWSAIHLYICFTVISSGGHGTGGIFGDQNDVGAAMTMGMPFFYYGYHFFTSKIMRLFMLIGIAAAIGAIVICGSRGAFLGMVMVFFTIFLLSKRKILLIIFGFIAIAVTSTFFLSDEYINEISTIGDTQDDTSSERLYSWELGLEMFSSHPILGVGPGQYPWVVEAYQVERGDLVTGHRSLGSRVSHSTYIDLISEFGLVGIICFIVMGYSVFWRLLECRTIATRLKKEDAKNSETLKTAELIRATYLSLFASFGGIMASGAFISILYYPHIWLNVALAMALHRFALLQTKLDEKNAL